MTIASQLLYERSDVLLRSFFIGTMKEEK